MTKENWDWKDEFFTLLAPHVGGWDWKQFESMPVRRLERWADKIKEDFENEESLSIREMELRKALKWFMGGSKKS